MIHPRTAILFGLALLAISSSKTARAESLEKPTKITFDDVKFSMKPDEPFKRSMLTEKIEQLDGKVIRIRGFFLPTSVYVQKGIKRFVFVRDDKECCFGPNAALYDNMVVEMVPGTSADFTVAPISVEGKLSIQPFVGPNGKHLSVYHLEGRTTAR